MSDEVATAVLEPPVQRRDPKQDKPKRQKPWAVIVLNDDEHTYAYVIETLQKVFHYEVEKCFQLTKQIDATGQAVVWSGSREVAELKRDQIKGAGKDFYAEAGPVMYPLGCTIEEMP